MTFREACRFAESKGCRVSVGRVRHQPRGPADEFVRVTLPFSDGSNMGYHYQSDFYSVELLDGAARDELRAHAVLDGVRAVRGGN